jgi:hypothetical protein
MAEYTKVAYPGVGSQSLFGRQLALLARELCLCPCRFSREERCLISHMELTVGRYKPPYSEIPLIQFSMCYNRIYASWARGFDLAMHDALSRICHSHYDKLSPHSIFHYIEKLDEGEALQIEGDWSKLLISEKQLDDG